MSSIIKVKNKNEIEGIVAVENWANPRTFLVDICLENGDTMPVEKEELEFIKVEEL